MRSYPVQIQRVSIRPQATGQTLYRITDSTGETYATTNLATASLCTRARETRQRVILSSTSGWFYRDLLHVRLVDENEPVTP
jgi:hypothetical protein